MGADGYSAYSAAPPRINQQWNSVNTRCKSALSLIVILGAAVVALICDLLKGNNEQLRELAIELKVRREEENKRFQMLAPHALAAAAGNGIAAAIPAMTPARRGAVRKTSSANRRACFCGTAARRLR